MIMLWIMFYTDYVYVYVLQVTGANKGIGFAIVKGLCEKFDGAVYLTARDQGRGLAAVADLNKVNNVPVLVKSGIPQQNVLYAQYQLILLGYKPLYHQLDITDPESVKNFAAHIKQNHGGIDCLVNNAAIAFKNNATEAFGEQAEKTIFVNYKSLVSTCDILFPLLKPRARVVNVSSSEGHLLKIPNPELRNKLSSNDLTVTKLNDLMDEFVVSAKLGHNDQDGWGHSTYAVSKVGVSALTRIQQKLLAADTSRPGIAVNSVHPGYVDTDMTSHKGPLTIEEGASAPLFLALMPPGDNEPKGCYVWCDKQIVDWTGSQHSRK